MSSASGDEPPAPSKNPYLTTEGVILVGAKPPPLPKLLASRYKCNNCGKDVTNESHVRCAECSSSPPFDLCVHCFSVGAQLAPHKASHDYKVFSSAGNPIYEAGWLAADELLLLEGIRLFGLGNWVDVAEHVVGKNSRQCQEHYFRVYVDVDSFPRQKEPLSEGERKEMSPTRESGSERKRAKNYKTQASLPIDHSRGSYMEKRQQFETPYYDDAEIELMDVVFNDEDTFEETQLKVRALQCFNNILEERDLKRKFIVRNDLLQWQQTIRNCSREEAQLKNEMACLLQAMPREQWKRFIKGYTKERRIRDQIASYQHLRKQGVRTMNEAETYYQAKKKRARGSSSLFSSSSSSRRRGGLGEPSSTSSMMLTDRERGLCNDLKLNPSQYVLVKEQFVREFLRSGHLHKQDAKSLCKLESTKQVMRIFDFLQETGCINRPSLGDGSSAPAARGGMSSTIMQSVPRRRNLPVVYRQTVRSSPFTSRKSYQ